MSIWKLIIQRKSQNHKIAQAVQEVEHKMKRIWDEEQVVQFFHTEGEAIIEAEILISANLREAKWLTGLNAIEQQLSTPSPWTGPVPQIFPAGT